jgi:hypothetical protein
MEQAIEYLSDTDEPCAVLRSNMERAEFKAKQTKASIFRVSEGSVAERNAIADTSLDTELAYEDYFKAMLAFDAMKNRRATEAIVVETWRSLNANRRQG